MRYLVYVDTAGRFEIDCSMRDEVAGIIGSIRNAPRPLADADTRSEAVRIARERLRLHPSQILYVADLSGQVYEIVIDRSYHEAREADRRKLDVACTCFFLSALWFAGGAGLKSSSSAIT